GGALPYRDGVERRWGEARSSSTEGTGDEGGRTDFADCCKGGGVSTAKGLRRLHGRRDRREGEAMEARAARGGTRVRAGAREPQGRDRRARGSDRIEAGEELVLPTAIVSAFIAEHEFRREH